jgi:molybdopterin molybdotransferase
MNIFQQMQGAACGCEELDADARLMSVDAALRAGLALAPEPQADEDLALAEASGRVLARPVRAQADMPPFDNAGMDGYALRVGDIGKDAVLPVRDVSAAGGGAAALMSGSAMRIFTGAPLPRGADAVVMQEMVQREGDAVTLRIRPGVGDNIRRRGEDQRRGAPVLAPGRLLDARAIAACAGAGAGRLRVWRKLRVGLVLTGDELRPAGAPLPEGAIWDVNTPMLRSLITCGWAAVTQVRHVPDTAADLADALAALAREVDLIVTSGGVSVGDRDHMRGVLATLGAEVGVSGVAMKPGKPVTLSRLGRVPVISLPGNPVSACVTWLVLGAPLAARMAGQTDPRPARRLVRSGGPLQHRSGRCEYRPARLSGHGGDGLDVVSTGAGTYSAQLMPLAAADGLVLIPAETDTLATGDMLEFLPFPS